MALLCQMLAGFLILHFVRKTTCMFAVFLCAVCNSRDLRIRCRRIAYVFHVCTKLCCGSSVCVRVADRLDNAVNLTFVSQMTCSFAVTSAVAAVVLSLHAATLAYAVCHRWTQYSHSCSESGEKILHVVQISRLIMIVVVVIIVGKCWWCCNPNILIARVHQVHLMNVQGGPKTGLFTEVWYYCVWWRRTEICVSECSVLCPKYDVCFFFILPYLNTLCRSSVKHHYSQGSYRPRKFPGLGVLKKGLGPGRPWKSPGNEM